MKQVSYLTIKKYIKKFFGNKIAVTLAIIMLGLTAFHTQANADAGYNCTVARLFEDASAVMTYPSGTVNIHISFKCLLDKSENNNICFYADPERTSKTTSVDRFMYEAAPNESSSWIRSSLRELKTGQDVPSLAPPFGGQLSFKPDFEIKPNGLLPASIIGSFTLRAVANQADMASARKGTYGHLAHMEIRIFDNKITTCENPKYILSGSALMYVIQIPEICKIADITPLDFGTHQNLNRDITAPASVKIACNTTEVPYSVTFNDGKYATEPRARRMKSASDEHYIDYQLNYLATDAPAGDTTDTKFAGSQTEIINLLGKIKGRAGTTPGGTYTDVITVTLNY